MCPYPSQPRRGRAARRPAAALRAPRGLSLIELLIAISIMAMVASTVGALARAVQMAADYGEGHSTATQHARVSLERIGRMVQEATASESFPGAVVFGDTINSWYFPDTLVVWHPSTSASNPTGLPLFSELVVYCPSPTAPAQLLEITNPTDNRTVPDKSNTSAWASELSNLKTGSSSTKTLLTDLLRVCTLPAGGGTPSSMRGAVRFSALCRPSAAQWAGYRAGSVAWNQISWVQSVYGSQTGLAQCCIRTELQLMPGYNSINNAADLQAIPFLGSTAVYYQLHQ